MYDFLKGTRVLDLTSVVLGPLATQYLGDFGADVIKVEPPTGDIFRYINPSRAKTMGAGYLNYNRNKRAISLDLKSNEDRAVFFELLDEANVLVHNMRPAAAKRLGLEQNALREKYPGLIYCVSAGYGKAGRNAENPAYDDIIQGACGLAFLNKDMNGEPRFLPTIMCDKIGGMHLAMAVLAGLVHQSNTGKGCFIEAPMYEGAVSFLMSEQLSGHSFIPPLGHVGYDRLLSSHRRPYPTKDGYIAVLPYNGKHWARFLEFIGRADIAFADWVQESSARSDNIDKLYEIVADVMPSRTTAEWMEIFRDIDIPSSPVNSLNDLFEDEHLKDVGFFQEMEHPTEGNLRVMRSPFWASGVDERPDLPAPVLAKAGEKITWNSRKK